MKIVFPPSEEQEQKTQQRINRLTEMVKEQPNLVNTEKYKHVYEFLQYEDYKEIKKWNEYLKTADDYKFYKDLTPKFNGLNQGTIRNVEEGEAFLSFVKSQSKNQTDMSPEKFMKIVFPQERVYWTNLDTPQGWQKYFIENHKKNFEKYKFSELPLEDRKFYYAVSEWLDRKTKNIDKTEAEEFKKQARQLIFHEDIAKQPETPEIIPSTQIDQTSPPTIKNETTTENIPEINPIILPSNPIDFSQKDNWLVNGFEIKTIETTSENNQENNGNNGNENSNLPFKHELTPSQVIRLMVGRGEWDAKYYAEHISQLATYVVHRGEISYLLNLFSQNHLDFPKVIADLGAGPSTAYSAYEELSPTIESFSYEKPSIIDIDKNPEMMSYGSNPNKKVCDISQKIDLEDQSVDMAQSTFVFHHLKSDEILRTLIESNRITKNGGFLNIVCRQPFSQSFLSGVEQLGYELITQHGEILTSNQQMFKAISQEIDTESAKRFQNRFKNSFILLAQKINNVNENIPSSDNFTFDHQKKTTREKRPILDLKNYNIDSSPLTENIERLTDSIVTQLSVLEVSPLRQKGGLIPGQNEIESSYHMFSDNLRHIQSLYDKIYNKIKISPNSVTPEQLIQFNQLREQLKRAKDYKSFFRQKQAIR